MNQAGWPKQQQTLHKREKRKTIEQSPWICSCSIACCTIPSCSRIKLSGSRAETWTEMSKGGVQVSHGHGKMCLMLIWAWYHIVRLKVRETNGNIELCPGKMWVHESWHVPCEELPQRRWSHVALQQQLSWYSLSSPPTSSLAMQLEHLSLALCGLSVCTPGCVSTFCGHFQDLWALWMVASARLLA